MLPRGKISNFSFRGLFSGKLNFRIVWTCQLGRILVPRLFSLQWGRKLNKAWLRDWRLERSELLDRVESGSCTFSLSTEEDRDCMHSFFFGRSALSWFAVKYDCSIIFQGPIHESRYEQFRWNHWRNFKKGTKGTLMKLQLCCKSLFSFRNTLQTFVNELPQFRLQCVYWLVLIAIASSSYLQSAPNLFQPPPPPPTHTHTHTHSPA